MLCKYAICEKYFFSSYPPYYYLEAYFNYPNKEANFQNSVLKQIHVYSIFSTIYQGIYIRGKTVLLFHIKDKRLYFILSHMLR